MYRRVVKGIARPSVMFPLTRFTARSIFRASGAGVKAEPFGAGTRLDATCRGRAVSVGIGRTGCLKYKDGGTCPPLFLPALLSGSTQTHQTWYPATGPLAPFAPGHFYPASILRLHVDGSQPPPMPRVLHAESDVDVAPIWGGYYGASVPSR